MLVRERMEEKKRKKRKTHTYICARKLLSKERQNEFSIKRDGGGGGVKGRNQRGPALQRQQLKPNFFCQSRAADQSLTPGARAARDSVSSPRPRSDAIQGLSRLLPLSLGGAVPCCIH